MGQYYVIVNIDKRQYLHPHCCGDGLKLLEFGASGEGTMLCLAVLLADGNNRGGGDLRSDAPIIGSWKGDRVVVAGDYADKGGERYGLVIPPDMTLYAFAEASFTNVSHEALEALAADQWIREAITKQGCYPAATAHHGEPCPNQPDPTVPAQGQEGGSIVPFPSAAALDTRRTP